MKYLTISIVITLILFLGGCQIQTETKYQCVNGEIVNSLNLCSSQICPEMNCSECPKETEPEIKEVIKYLCQDGSVEDNLVNCDNKEVDEDYDINSDNYNYKFNEYDDYAKFIKEDLENELGFELNQGFAYGGNEGTEQLRKDGKIYFIVFEHGNWDLVRYWAVEVNAETGKLLKYKEVTKGNNEIDLNKLWW